MSPLTGGYRLGDMLRPLYVGGELPDWVMTLVLYTDDSREVDERMFGIGGYLGLLDDWDQSFVSEWHTEVLNGPRGNIPEFKTEDCRHRRGVFAGWTDADVLDIAQRICRVIANPIREHVYGIGCAVVMPTVSNQDMALLAERQALVLSLLYVVEMAIDIMISTKLPGPLECIHDHQGGMHGEIMDAHQAVREIEAIQHPDIDVRPIRFDESDRVLPIQAADVMAYETRKELRGWVKGRPRSKMLAALMDGRPHILGYGDINIIGEVAMSMDQGAILPAMTCSGSMNDLFPRAPCPGHRDSGWPAPGGDPPPIIRM